MIIRRQITSNFTVIPNEAILDTRLSASARWLLVYLLSRPNDWQVQVGDIQKKGGVGREKAYRLIKELISVGWVRKSISREDNGQWGGIEYVITDQPEVEEAAVSPCDEKSYLANSLPANHHLTKDLKKPRTEKLQNTEKNILSDPAMDADFEEFWAAYPKRVNNPKKSAKAKYIVIRKRGVQHDEIMAGTKAYASFRQRDIEQGGHQKYTKMAEHWLNGECWANDYSIPDDNTKLAPKVAALMASDEQMAAITAVYKGPHGDLDRAKANLAAELAKGVELGKIVEAAQKYVLYVKQMQQNGVEMAATTLDTWLKFKWREMDAYYIYKNPVERYPVLKAMKDKGK